jgi:hypothetical protein
MGLYNSDTRVRSWVCKRVLDFVCLPLVHHPDLPCFVNVTVLYTATRLDTMFKFYAYLLQHVYHTLVKYPSYFSDNVCKKNTK